MIFVTVGTTSFPFDRLLKAVDEAMPTVKTEDLIVQKGVSKYSFKYPKVKIYKELSFPKMIAYMKEARATITHGGPATIFQVIKYSSSKPMVVPRSSEFGEHVDTHEIVFCQTLSEKGFINLIGPKDNIVKELTNNLKRIKKAQSTKYQNSRLESLVSRLNTYTEYLK